MKKLWLPLLFSIFWICAKAQYVAEGANSPKIKWQKIENDKSEIIFPKGLSSYAYKIGEIVDFIDKNERNTIGKKNLKTKIILNAQSYNSNGFVTVAPFRSEFFALPIQDWSVMGPVNWLNLLAIHEYRHVLQYSNTTVGFTGLAKIITGNTGWGAAQNLSIPNWFSEGDAVLAETLESGSGRGRNANFFLEQRAQFLANKKYTYQKARNDSYRSNMPSHYPLGYSINLYAREKFGPEVWKNVLHDASTYYWPFYPFSHALKKHSGLSSRKIYKAAYQADREIFNELVSKNNLQKPEIILEKEPRKVTYYRWPFIQENGNQYYLKSSFEQISQLTLRRNGKEKKLYTFSISPNRRISYGKNKAVWVESQPHPRWGNTDFTKLVLFDLEKKKALNLLEKQKIISAGISKDDELLAIVKFDEDFNYSLEIIGLGQKSENKSVPNPENLELAYPCFDEIGNLYYLAKKNNLEAIYVHRLESDNSERLTPWMSNPLSDLAVNGGLLYFRADFIGIEQIYGINLNTGSRQILQLTHSLVGAAFPFYDAKNEKLYFSDFSLKGYLPTSIDFNFNHLNPVLVKIPTEMEAYSRVNAIPENEKVVEKLEDKQYIETPYKGFMKGLRFHSWGFLPTFSNDQLVSSFSTYLQADDFLGKNALQLEYGYNLNEKGNSGGLTYSYAGLFPKINASYQIRERNIENARKILQHFTESESSLNVTIPLSFVKRSFNQSLTFNTGINHIQYITEGIRDNLINPSVNYVNGRISHSMRQVPSYQALQPKWGYGINASYKKSFTSGDAEIFQTGADIMLPGFKKTHGLQLVGAYQFENLKNNYQFPDQFSYGRGYDLLGIQNSWRLSANYRLPLAYPDFGLAGITYFKRISANLFYDHAYVSDGKSSGILQSTGIELLFSNTYLNFIEIPLGIRLGYRLPNDLYGEKGLFVRLVLGQF